jgi:hypothetical protein
MPGYPCCCDPPIGSCVDCTETPQQFSVTFSGYTLPSGDCEETECEAFFGAYTLEKGEGRWIEGHCVWGARFAAGYIDTWDGLDYVCDTCTQDVSHRGIEMTLWIPRAGEFRLLVTWSCKGGSYGNSNLIYQDTWSATIVEPFDCDTYSATHTFGAGTNPCGYDNVTVLVEGI